MSVFKVGLEDFFRFIAGLLRSPSVKSAEPTRPGIKDEIPKLKIEWRFQHEHTLVPSTVRRSVRWINDIERELLCDALGLSSSETIVHEHQVEVLQMQIQEAWILHFCGPDCCPPELLLKVDESNYLFVGGKSYSHGLEVFANEQSCLIPFTQSLEVIRTIQSHIPLQFVRTGAPIVHNERNANIQIELESVHGFCCEFLRIDQLPQEFKDGFTPLNEFPSNPSHSFVGPARGYQGQGTHEEPGIGG